MQWAHINRQRVQKLIKEHEIEVNEQLGKGNHMSASIEIIAIDTENDVEVLLSFMRWLVANGERMYRQDTGNNCIGFEYDFNHHRIILEDHCTQIE